MYLESLARKTLGVDAFENFSGVETKIFGKTITIPTYARKLAAVAAALSEFNNPAQSRVFRGDIDLSFFSWRKPETWPQALAKGGWAVLLDNGFTPLHAAFLVYTDNLNPQAAAFSWFALKYIYNSATHVILDGVEKASKNLQPILKTDKL